MLPGGTLAAVFLLSLIPGWVYLRVTERSRKPREQSALHELLEVLTIGVLTTGVSALVIVFVVPGLVLDVTKRPLTSGDLRIGAALVLAALALAVLISYLAARAFIKRNGAKQQYEQSVWMETFARSTLPRDTVPFVRVRLKNGDAVDGILHAYTMSANDTHRDITLIGPISVSQGGEVLTAEYDRWTVSASEIEHIALNCAASGTVEN